MKYFLVICFFTFTVCLSACQSKMICPAYQSAFIYNDSIRARLFAYFDEDSLPAIIPYASKNKYGIIEKVGERKRINEMQTIKMERVFPAKDHTKDSLLLALGASESENSNIDSLVNARLEAQYHYNVEQETYMKLFGEQLYQPPPPEPDEEATAATEETAADENMTRKERRQARREAKEKEREQQEQQEGADENQGEDENQGDF